MYIDTKPKKQIKMTMFESKFDDVEKEVDKLHKVGFLIPSHYLKWIANPVDVPKENGLGRVCVDFTDLNKACHKDSFSLPRISQLVDFTVRHEKCIS